MSKYKEFSLYFMFVCASLLCVACGRSGVKYTAIEQVQVEVQFGTGSESPANTALKTTSMSFSLSCNNTDYPASTVIGGSNLTLVNQSSCNIILVSFTLPATQEVYIPVSSPASIGASGISATYRGSFGNTALITPTMQQGSISPVAKNSIVMFTFQSSNLVVGSWESNYSQISVVKMYSGAIQLTFSTTSGSASLALETSSLPASWSASTTTCGAVNALGNCLIILTFSPTVANASWQTLTLPFTYTALDGVSRSAAVTLNYKGIERLKWSYLTGGAVTSRPLLSSDGNTLYVTSGDNKLHVIDAATGALKWTQSTATQIQASPLFGLDVSKIYIGAIDGKIYSASAPASGITGVLNWSSATGCGGPIYGDIALSPDGSLIIGTCYSNSRIYGYSTTNGNILWNTTNNIGVVSTPIFSPNGTYFYAQGTGNTIRKFLTADRTASAYSPGQVLSETFAMSADGATLYAGQGQMLVAINTSNMSNQWSSANTASSLGGQQGPTLSPDGSALYISASAGYLYKFAANPVGTSNVSPLWSNNFGVFTHDPAYTNTSGSAVFVQATTAIYEFNTTNGNQNWVYSVPNQCQWSSTGGIRTSADDFTIYFGCFTDQKVYALNETVIKQ